MRMYFSKIQYVDEKVFACMKVDSKVPSENMQNIYLKYYLVPLS